MRKCCGLDGDPSRENLRARFARSQKKKKERENKKGRVGTWVHPLASLMMADADRVHSVQTDFGELEPARQKAQVCVCVAN